MKKHPGYVFMAVVLIVFCSHALPHMSAEDDAQENRLTVYAGQEKDIISRHIYGHFSEHLGRCIYGGYWVGEDSEIPNVRGIRQDIVQALKHIRIPNLRWPGGCFADEYHWKDGIGPREDRPTMINTHWGGVTENNHFGTHEYMDLCSQLDCEPYICGNLGSGTVEEMQQWVEYITFDGISPMADLRRANGRTEPWHLKFFGVGNENWGCGGNMRPEFYADQYRRYQTYVKNYSGNDVYKIACGPYKDDEHWTEVLMKQAADSMDGLSLHYYVFTGGWANRGSATEFNESDWFQTLNQSRYMEELITRHSLIMDRYDPDKRIGLIVDEWGNWYEPASGTNPAFLYQQNTLRDALTAGMTLNAFNRHSGRVKMANLAQTVNVLQALILTQGPDIVLTPTYHVFDLFQVHQDAVRLPFNLKSSSYTYGKGSMPALDVSASKDSAGRVHISICHVDPNKSADLTIALPGMPVGSVSGRILTAGEMNAHNTFDDKDNLIPRSFDNISVADEKIKISLPAKCVVVLTVK